MNFYREQVLAPLRLGLKILLNKKLLLQAISVVLMFMSMLPVSFAQEEAEASSIEPVVAEISPAPADPSTLPLWEGGLLGLGASQPAYPGSEVRVTRLLGLPYMIYRGEFLRIDRSTVGVRAIRTDRTELDVGFAASLGSRSEEVEVRRGMDDLGLLLEFGPRLKINLGEVSKGRSDSRIQLPLRGVFDANDHLKFRGVSFEPQWVLDLHLPQGWDVSTGLGAVLGDQKLVDTFYRVSPAEATDTRPGYDAKSGLIALRASLFISYLVNSEIRFFSFVRLDSVNGAANYNSPLVKRDNGWAAGMGLAWTLARSDAKAMD